MTEQSWCVTGYMLPEDAKRLEFQIEELSFEHGIAQPTLAWFEDGTNRLWKVDIYFYGPPDEALLLDALSRAEIEDWKYQSTQVEDKDWVSESQKLLAPVRAGKFLVYGSHDADKHDPALINLQIDAGQAFGTGKHETTASCLALLSQLPTEEAGPQGSQLKILDLGTGSGVLALAAQRLWPKAQITATDIDPIAVSVTGENIAINKGLERACGETMPGIALITADGFDDPDLALEGPFDLILANILAKPLIDMAPDLAVALKPNGTVILSGLLKTQQSDVCSAYEANGIQLHQEQHDGDWSALWMTKN